MRSPSISQRDNFCFLFAALFVLVVLGPVLTVSLGSFGVLVSEASLSVSLVIALWSLQASRTSFYTGTALVVINIAATAISFLLDSPAAVAISRVSGLVFLSLSIFVAARQVFRRDRVDLNKIVGALCTYLLIGVIWAMLFQMLEGFVPESFAGLEGHEGHAWSWRLIYFSFVTLTTLGYGDVLPLTIYAENLVVLEALLGQFYLAVLVAGLIGAYLNDRQ